jgi:hypothetical protein
MVCTYGAEVNQYIFEAAVLAETDMKTPWIPYTSDEFVARLKEEVPTYHEEAHALEGDVKMASAEAPLDDTIVATDVAMAPAEVGDVTMAPAEAPIAPADEISDGQAFLRDRFAVVKLNAGPARRGRPKAPIICGACKLVFHSSDAKYNHMHRGKCIPVYRLKSGCIIYNRAMPPLQPGDASPPPAPAPHGCAGQPSGVDADLRCGHLMEMVVGMARTAVNKGSV